MTKTTTLFPPVSLTRGWEEPLAELVPSQWGQVHLFDLCLWFGHVDTAWALALHGVRGCTLEDHHLGALPDARDGELISFCDCKGWETCRFCCWGFPLENGVWMKDWATSCYFAAEAAKRTAKMPLVRSLLDISSRDETLPFAMSEAAGARLLDLAILCSNVEAATNLAKTCQARPLRRWMGDELYFRKSTVFAALWAGANFEGLHVGFGGEVPLLRVLALHCEPGQWQQLLQFFPAGKNQWPTRNMRLGHHFLEEEFDGEEWVSMLKIQNAFKAGWDLKRIWTDACFDAAFGHDFCAASLLDMAVLCGQPECAGALGFAGVELKAPGVVPYFPKADCLDLHRRAVCGLGIPDWFRLRHGSASDCQSAAFAAARASLKRSFKHEGTEKGVALYQTLAKHFHPRDVPMVLVHHILGFSMEAPKIVDQLDLWAGIKGWMPSLEVASQGDDKTSPVNLNIEEQTGKDVVGEPGTPSAELPPEPAEATEADAKFMDDVTTVLRSDQNEPALSSDGVCLFRLKNLATSPHVTQLLLDATGLLAELHRRMLEAGCEVNPEWKLGFQEPVSVGHRGKVKQLGQELNGSIADPDQRKNPVKALFRPTTEADMVEWQASLIERGYELSREDHILALQSDRDLITQALRSIRSRYRPKLGQGGPCQERASPGDDPADLEDLADMDDAQLLSAFHMKSISEDPMTFLSPESPATSQFDLKIAASNLPLWAAGGSRSCLLGISAVSWESKQRGRRTPCCFSAISTACQLNRSLRDSQAADSVDVSPLLHAAPVILAHRFGPRVVVCSDCLWVVQMGEFDVCSLVIYDEDAAYQ
eukprot:s45_g39.t3